MSAKSLKDKDKLLPLYILKHFKKYILPKIEINSNEDTCVDMASGDLTLYQKFIGEYLRYNSPFKEILIYHGMGSGKTITALNVYNILYTYSSNWNLVILLPLALHDDPWLKDINSWLPDNDKYNDKIKNIRYVHYDSKNADIEFLDVISSINNSNTIFIIDEIHKFITSMYNKNKKLSVIYEYIVNEKKYNPNTRIILLTATPVVNNPFELSLLFNLLRKDILPRSEYIFNQLFIKDNAISVENKNMFQRRISGLVSYYIGGTPDKFAKRNVQYVMLTMTPYQEEFYAIYDMPKNNIKKKQNSFLTKQRQLCNFVFPFISDKINAAMRPVSFSKHNQTFEDDDEFDATNKESDSYISQLKDFVYNLKKYFLSIKNKSTDIHEDINTYKQKYNYNFNEYISSTDTKSDLLNVLYKHSPKFINIIFNIYATKGNVLVYSNYVSMEGLDIFKVYLELFEFIDINNDKDFNKEKIEKNKDLKYNNKRYFNFDGKTDKIERTKNKTIFNSSNNRYGKYCKIILLSPSGAEGINLSNVRQVHIIEPYWNEVKLEQVIGRAIRLCQHKDLPLNERVVDIYRYIMIRSNNKQTADQQIDELAKSKNNLLRSFIDTIKEIAVDCKLFKNHNMLSSGYECFQYTQESYFNNTNLKSYQSNINEDIYYNDGLNSNESIIKEIKVREIIAVRQIDDKSFSEEENYLMDYETGIVYDLITEQPIGNIVKNAKNEYNMYGNAYIISFIIDIPDIY